MAANPGYGVAVWRAGGRTRTTGAITPLPRRAAVPVQVSMRTDGYRARPQRLPCGARTVAAWSSRLSRELSQRAWTADVPACSRLRAASYLFRPGLSSSAAMVPAAAVSAAAFAFPARRHSSRCWAINSTRRAGTLGVSRVRNKPLQLVGFWSPTLRHPGGVASLRR